MAARAGVESMRHQLSSFPLGLLVWSFVCVLICLKYCNCLLTFFWNSHVFARHIMFSTLALNDTCSIYMKFSCQWRHTLIIDSDRLLHRFWITCYVWILVCDWIIILFTSIGNYNFAITVSELLLYHNWTWAPGPRSSFTTWMRIMKPLVACAILK